MYNHCPINHIKKKINYIITQKANYVNNYNKINIVLLLFSISDGNLKCIRYIRLEIDETLKNT